MKKLQKTQTIFHNIFEVSFKVGLSSKKDSWDAWGYKEYTTIVCAKDLDSVINDWPKYLLEDYPHTEGSGGSHYATEPVYGDQIRFLSIKLLHENVLILQKGK